MPVLPVIKRPAERPPPTLSQIPPQFKPPKVLQKLLEKTPEGITQEDNTEVCQQVVKPVASVLTSQSTKSIFSKFFGKRKLPDSKYLSPRESSKESSEESSTESSIERRCYVMHVNKEMQEETRLLISPEH